MEAQFWLDSWQRGGFFTSFHRKDIHPFTLAHLTPHTLKGTNVLVPLCGKSVDMLYAAQYANQVIGVELAPAAILQFFEENNLPFTQPNETTYVSSNITIYCRDFMQLSYAEIGHIDWIIDRASLVALPEEMRREYIRTIDRLSSVGTKQLVITLEYFPLLPSAPFCITPAEVEAYYGRGNVIQHVEESHQPGHGMVRRWNLEYLIEHGFVLTKYATGKVLSNAVFAQLENE